MNYNLEHYVKEAKHTLLGCYTPQDMMPLDKNDVMSMKSDTITKSKYDLIAEKISIRFSYIVTLIHKITNRNLDWYDFDNEGGEYNPGYFDPDSYMERISYTGSCKNSADDTGLYEYNFPTRWLYENFEEELYEQQETAMLAIQEKKNKEKLKKQRSNQYKEELKASIKSKLTLDEWNYIKKIFD